MLTYSKIILGVSASILLAAMFVFAAPATAQQSTPWLMITWQAKSYVPAWFQGKVFPTAHSQITASVELIDGGNLVDLSKQKIYWYVNDQLISNSLGVQTIDFNAPALADNTIDLRAEVPSYKSPVLKTIEIPVVQPEAVIEYPMPSNEFHSTPLSLRGWPFFFNVHKASQLAFSWTANGESSQNLENPETLVLNLNSDAPSGSSVNVSLTAKLPGSISDIATVGMNLVFIK